MPGCGSPNGPAALRSSQQPLAYAIQTAAPEPTSGRTALPAGAVRLTVARQRSVATIRVREPVANVPAPSDAVLTSRAFSGGFVMLPDGTFTADSTIAIDLDTLASDSSLRDEWVKINTLGPREAPGLQPRPERRGRRRRSPS